MAIEADRIHTQLTFTYLVWVVSLVLAPRKFLHVCPEGSFSLEAGMSACSECEPGHYAAADGSITCLACDEGYFANASGETICERCEVVGSSKLRDDDKTLGNG
eukprot:4246940-Amphidinium_carterae.1